MGDVVAIRNLLTTVDIDPDTVLKAAVGRLDEVLIIGWAKSDEYPGDFYMASSDADLAKALMLVLRVQKHIMDELP